MCNTWEFFELVNHYQREYSNFLRKWAASKSVEKCVMPLNALCASVAICAKLLLNRKYTTIFNIMEDRKLGRGTFISLI